LGSELPGKPEDHKPAPRLAGAATPSGTNNPEEALLVGGSIEETQDTRELKGRPAIGVFWQQKYLFWQYLPGNLYSREYNK
jgi:hypothetical protein